MTYVRGLIHGCLWPIALWGLAALTCNAVVFYHPDPYIRVAAANIYALLTAWAW